MNAIGVIALMYSALMWSSFFGSKKAGALLTDSSVNRSMISSIGRISIPSSGPHPSSASALRIASGR